ncbi:MAG: nucleotidyltransferase family protein [Eubacteriaceae bacterium]|jgi:predicted nucleotidyltransferase|nr:nucleotidyltransferase family protein [Eubacteriaceae bacterium]
MKAVGIVAEYNPFHLGHEYLVNTLKHEMGFTHIASVMSGPFVQRGEPALFGAFERAKAACACGVDLVVALPYAYSAQTAEVFARGAVAMLDAMGLGYMAFGCEDLNADAYFQAAEILSNEPPAFARALREALSQGESFAAARLKALESAMGQSLAFLRKPNNILALEYCKAILSQGSFIEPVFVQRLTGAPSARAVRASWPKSSIQLPFASRETLLSCAPVDKEGIEKLFIASAIAKAAPGIKEAAECSEGFESRLYSAAKASSTLEEAATAASSRRAPMARARRVYINSFFSYTYSDLRYFRTHYPTVGRALAMNPKGRELVRSINSAGSFQILTNAIKAGASYSEQDKKIAAFEEAAWRVYSMFSDQYSIEGSNGSYDHRLPYYLP